MENCNLTKRKIFKLTESVKEKAKTIFSLGKIRKGSNKRTGI